MSTSPLFEMLLRGALDRAFGAGDDPAFAAAPGRCTLVGEHVDYAGGLVLCVAIDLEVMVAVRVASGSLDRVAVGDRRFAREGPLRAAGAGYVFAAADALRHRGLEIPPVEVATTASLPAAAGLASSAAVIGATLVALLRLQGASLTAAELIDAAYAAEHDILGVPSGRLDEHAIVESPEGGAILLDCAAGTVSDVPWALDDVVLCVCDTGERHSVAGVGYRDRRAEAEAALHAAGLGNAQHVGAAAAIPELADPTLSRRLRHVVSETRRAAAAAEALRCGDAAALGTLMTESQRSLRDDMEVSTPRLDAVVEASVAVPGCLGARLVGAGFGGSVIALVRSSAAGACVDAMQVAAGEGSSAFVVHPSAGLAFTAGDAVTRV
ncbi:MAG: galactokinase [Candidatus Dormibacteraeota bacterium]|nr:galactokinase [Candidatus Dormibacteraeota bacterium]